MITETLLSDLARTIGAPDIHALSGLQGVSGGCINYAYRFQCGLEEYFVKFNLSARYPGMFEAEAAGLQLLHSKGVRVPEVIATGAPRRFVERQSHDRC